MRIIKTNTDIFSFLYYFTSLYHVVSCHSSHILAFCPSYFVYCHIYTTFAVAESILIKMKKVLYVLLQQFAEHELPYLTQPLRSDSFAMKENPKYEYRQCQDGGIL